MMRTGGQLDRLNGDLYACLNRTSVLRDVGPQFTLISPDEDSEAVRQGLEQAECGESRSAREVLAELIAKHRIPG